MHAKQERVESLNYYNDIYGVLNTCVFVCFETKQGVYMGQYTVKNMYNLYSINEQQCLVTTKIVQQYKCYNRKRVRTIKKNTLI